MTAPVPDAFAGDGAGANPVLEIESAVIGLLARREHSRYELAERLKRRFGGSAPVQQVLDDLGQRGLVSDERFAESYVAMRIRRGFGPLRIRAELQERGVGSELIEAKLDRGADAWMEQLREVAQQRFGMNVPEARSAQAKQARFLQYRGFPESMIRDYLWG